MLEIFGVFCLIILKRWTKVNALKVVLFKILKELKKPLKKIYIIVNKKTNHMFQKIYIIVKKNEPCVPKDIYNCLKKTNHVPKIMEKDI